MISVFVPSKGRSDKPLSTLKVLKDSLEFVTLVVESDEYEAYRFHYPSLKILVLPDRNRGEAFVRNFIIQYAHYVGIRWIIQADDDIRKAGRFQVDDAKVRRISISGHELLSHYTEQARRFTLLSADRDFTGYWRIRAGEEFCVPGWASAFYTMDVDWFVRNKCGFRPSLVYHGDVDLSMQVHALGGSTGLCSTHYVRNDFCSPGGFEWMAEEQFRQATETFLTSWPKGCIKSRRVKTGSVRGQHNHRPVWKYVQTVNFEQSPSQEAYSLFTEYDFQQAQMLGRM